VVDGTELAHMRREPEGNVIEIVSLATRQTRRVAVCSSTMLQWLATSIPICPPTAPLLLAVDQQFRLATAARLTIISRGFWRLLGTCEGEGPENRALM
jgi:hypothetical protein